MDMTKICLLIGVLGFAISAVLSGINGEGMDAVLLRCIGVFIMIQALVSLVMIDRLRALEAREQKPLGGFTDEKTQVL